MEWKEVRNSVYKLDSDSTNPRPTTRALKELVRYLDEYLPLLNSELDRMDKELKQLRVITKKEKE